MRLRLRSRSRRTNKPLSVLPQIRVVFQVWPFLVVLGAHRSPNQSLERRMSSASPICLLRNQLASLSPTRQSGLLNPPSCQLSLPFCLLRPLSSSPLTSRFGCRTITSSRTRLLRLQRPIPLSLCGCRTVTQPQLKSKSLCSVETTYSSSLMTTSQSGCGTSSSPLRRRKSPSPDGGETSRMKSKNH